MEDDASLGFVIKSNLQHVGYEVIHSTDGESGWQQFLKKSFDLVLLDVMMPEKDGYTVARQIRMKNEFVPLIFLTARSMEEDKALGFRCGGDDYITKPFNMQELFFRIDVFLRRTGHLHSARNMRFNLGNLCFDYAELIIIGPEGTAVNLTQKEADLLKFFCENTNKILKREEILRQVWGKDDYFLGRSMDVFITKLRKHFKSEPRIGLETIHGIGFKFSVAR